MKLPQLTSSFIVDVTLYELANELGYDTSAMIDKDTLLLSDVEYRIHCTASDYAVLKSLSKELEQ